jgi:basic amino acid/polyamine antiporter, APA family
MAADFKEIFRRKIIPLTFERTIGLFGASTIGIGALMGAGLYVLIGMGAAAAGPSVWLSFLICGGLAYLTTLMFADFAKLVPKSGGGYAYSYDALGSIGGFVAGWFLALGSIFACALYAVGFAQYFATFLGDVSPWFVTLLALLLVAVSTLINSLGADSDRIQIVLTWGNVAILLLLISVSVFHFDTDLAKPMFPNGFSGTLSAISIIYISFFGYQLIANNADEIRKPKKNVPKAMKISMGMAIVFYLIIGITAVFVIPWNELGASDAPLVLVAEKGFGAYGWVVISAGGVLAAASALNSTLLSQARQIYAMGKNRFFPDLLGKLNKKSRTPVAAIVGGGLLVAVVLSSFDLEFIAKAANFCLLVSLLPVSLALRKIYLENENKRPKNIFKRRLPEIALAVNVALLFTLDRFSLLFGLQLAVVGAVLYFFYSRKRETRSRSGMNIVLTEDKSQFLRSGSRILVPMANPENQQAIFAVSNALLGKNKGEIIALSVVQTPKQTDFYSALSEQDISFEIMERTAELAKLSNAPIKPMIRASHNISQGIVHAAVDKACNMIVMGYGGKPEKGKKNLMQHVLNETNTDIVFIKIHKDLSDFIPKKIAVAMGGKVNTGLMVDLAAGLADNYEGHISFLTILPKDFTLKQKTDSDKVLAEAIQRNRKAVLYSVHTYSSADPLQLLVELSKDYDLLIIGTVKVKFFQRNVLGTFATELAEQAKCSVAVVRTTDAVQKIGKQMMGS